MSHATDVVGFYPSLPNGDISEDALCASDCSSAQTEDWTPIFRSSEADTPTHCSKCEALIPHALTSDGYAYVGHALVEHAKDGFGRAPILKQWVEEYLDGVEETDLRAFLYYSALGWPDTDEYTPRKEG